MKVSRESMILAAICAADLVTTLWFVNVYGGAEANPLMRYYLERSTALFVVAKVILVCGPLAVLEWARRMTQFVTGMLRTAIALYLCLYGTVVWRINSANAARNPSPAELAAVEHWAAHPAGAGDGNDQGPAPRVLRSDASKRPAPGWGRPLVCLRVPPRRMPGTATPR